jgi:hypothetical protein
MAVDRHTGDIAGHGLAQSFDNPLTGTNTPTNADRTSDLLRGCDGGISFAPHGNNACSAS